jgi:methyltransferase, FkbM family
MVTQIRGLTFCYREHSYDETILKEVVHRNSYLRKLPSKTNDIWLDIGGHIGAFACQASREAKQIISFEPDPTNFNLLLKNLAMNNCQNVTPVNCAVRSFSGAATLYLNQRHDQSSHSFFVKRGRLPVLVPVRAALEIFDEFQPNKLKLDCEGSEYEIIMSLGQKLQTLEGIILEYHFNMLKDRSCIMYRELCQELQHHFRSVLFPKDPKKNWHVFILATNP